MAWTETCPLDQRLAFIAEWLRDQWTMTELAERSIRLLLSHRGAQRTRRAAVVLYPV